MQIAALSEAVPSIGLNYEASRESVYMTEAQGDSVAMDAIASIISWSSATVKDIL